jgi:parvulin-like peptidyl-prolyl isomerase
MNRFPWILLLVFLAFGCGSTPDGEGDPIPTDPGVGPTAPPPMVGDSAVPEQDLLDPNRIVARANDEIITVRSIMAEYGEALRSIGEPSDERYRMALDRFAMEMIVGRIFVQAAERLGLDITKADLDRVVKDAEEELKKRDTTLDEDLKERGVPRWEWEEEQRKKLLVQRFFRMSVGQEAAVSAETRPVADMYVRPIEIRGFYERNIERFERKEQARVGALFIRITEFENNGRTLREAQAAARSHAEALAKRARSGESFDALVLEVHGAPLGSFSEPFARGTQRDFVENFVWSAKVGRVSDPIDTGAGFLVLKLTERTEAGLVPYADVKNGIAEQIRFLKYNAAQLKVQSELLQDSVVEPEHFKRELKRRFQTQTEQVLNALSI